MLLPVNVLDCHVEPGARFSADERMWHYDWPAGTIDPKAVIFGMKQLGVDVSAWTGERSAVPG